jgi:exoribonuclease R
LADGPGEREIVGLGVARRVGPPGIGAGATCGGGRTGLDRAQEDPATISGVASFGLFVLLDRYQVDGLVHVSALGDDYYRLDERTHALVGRRRKQTFRLGDPVEVQVVRVDREERKIDFRLVR